MLDILYANYVTKFYIDALSRELQNPDFIVAEVTHNLLLDVMFTVELERNMSNDANKFLQYIKEINPNQPEDLTSYFHDYLKMKYQQWRES